MHTSYLKYFISHDVTNILINGAVLVLLLIFVWRTSDILLEQSAEMLRILEPQFIRNLADRLAYKKTFVFLSIY